MRQSNKNKESAEAKWMPVQSLSQLICQSSHNAGGNALLEITEQLKISVECTSCCLCKTEIQCNNLTNVPLTYLIFINPSISYTAYPFAGLEWGVEAHQLTLGERHGTPWTGHQSITGLTLSDKQPLMLKFTPTGNSELNLTLPSVGKRNPGESHEGHGEHM